MHQSRQSDWAEFLILGDEGAYLPREMSRSEQHWLLDP